MLITLSRRPAGVAPLGALSHRLNFNSTTDDSFLHYFKVLIDINLSICILETIYCFILYLLHHHYMI